MILRYIGYLFSNNEQLSFVFIWRCQVYRKVFQTLSAPIAVVIVLETVCAREMMSEQTKLKRTFVEFPRKCAMLFTPPYLSCCCQKYSKNYKLCFGND
jgi:hypothetical protein